MKIIDVNGNERECAEVYPDKDYPGYMRVEFKSAVRSHHEWYPIKDFTKNNPDLVYLTKDSPILVADTLGIVSSSTYTTIKDTKQKWDDNCYADFPIWISRGKGEGQIRNVESNTRNSIKIDKPWDIMPDKSSQYVISHNIHDPQPFGNTLPGYEGRVKDKVDPKIEN